ncbi:MAG TPA: hypothetical protein VFI96_08140 [Longimicrobiaceae bacterium]|nr:hypothetical protein [Longimicrobiaceae bacterium]
MAEVKDPGERTARQLHEHHRYLVLRLVQEGSRSDPRAIVTGSELVRTTELPPEEVFRILEFLARRGYIHYLGAGPRVRIARVGADYLQRGRGRRESVRDPARAN